VPLDERALLAYTDVVLDAAENALLNRSLVSGVLSIF
jgi:hypothetical protein